MAIFFKCSTIFKLVQGKNVTSREKDTPPGSHETNVLTKFHEDWTKNVTSRVFKCFHFIHIEKTAPPPGGHVSSPIWTIFELIRDINKTNVLIKFHDDWAKIVTSRVFTRNTAPPPGGHFFQRTGTFFNSTNISLRQTFWQNLHEDWASNVTSTLLSFELSRGIIRTKSEINVASTEFTRQMLTTHARRTTDKR
ncbi:hypothetical protein DPMN_129812 [Dreissena polymorpha]|uniref:Uncharacterized protein n=1 Tax=Dreissena polymorpha TaxID=45954 RepID=A0A9D4JYL3_DREPO|nr:hypothetical protein DPMN_129812 [Dreissena polymorpha]